MPSTEFQSWSLLHAGTLAACAALIVAVLLLVRRSRCVRTSRRVRLVVGWGCLAAWLLNTGYWTMPQRFDLASSLPLHFCNIANLFGALAVLGRLRLFQGVIYFWSALYIWAFLTPTLEDGPALPGFWVFWIYHLFIALALVHVLVLDRFRPAFRDLLANAAFTLAYVAVLALVDRLAGWNYGFLGDEIPNTRTPIDVLGPYPLRILWMILIGAAAFLLLWLPFAPRKTSDFKLEP